jgi:hypothetical protein
MEDITKLPKWAQSRIRIAESKIAETHRLLQRVHPTNIKIQQSYDEAPIYLPADKPVTFSLPTGDISVSIKGNGLEVYSHCNSLSIRPRVSNVVTIKQENM